MNTLTVAAASLNLIPLDFEHNSSVIKNVIAEARSKGVQILCLPELCISGYGCEDAFYFPHVAEKSLHVLFDLLPEAEHIAVTLGLPILVEGARYNAVAFVVNGSLQGFVCKQHLAGDGIHYEPRWFTPWKPGTVSFIKHNNHDYPCGDLVFDIGKTRVGFEICEDAWVNDRPGYALASRSVDIILNPSASHFAINKVIERRKIVADGSSRFDAVYVYSNLLGNEAGRVIYDGDTIIAQNGVILSHGPRLSFNDYVLTPFSVSFEEKAKIHPDNYAIECPAVLGLAASCPQSTGAKWEHSPAIEFEEFSRATALGLFDYMRKSFSKGLVLSLSGGADSGCAALLVHLLAVFALKEIGSEKIKEKLSYWNGFSKFKLSDSKSMTRALLHCVYQATENSSKTTQDAARMMAESLGALFHQVSIQEILSTFTERFEPILGRSLEWSKDDFALQNIQARVRSPGIWLIANVQGSLLLTTSNRSEASVGYATMDGDTSGGLAPIAGVSKHFIRQFLLHVEKHGLEDIDPLAALSCITSQSPTAELRPLSAKQTDEGDLMPYIVLDYIERSILLQRHSRDEVTALAKERFGEKYPTIEIEKWVDTFYRLWRSSQWKRERMAPSFHLDSYNIDPRSWLRYPILSGGL